MGVHRVFVELVRTCVELVIELVVKNVELIELVILERKNLDFFLSKSTSSTSSTFFTTSSITSSTRVLKVLPMGSNMSQDRGDGGLSTQPGFYMLMI